MYSWCYSSARNNNLCKISSRDFFPNIVLLEKILFFFFFIAFLHGFVFLQFMKLHGLPPPPLTVYDQNACNRLLAALVIPGGRAVQVFLLLSNSHLQHQAQNSLCWNVLNDTSLSFYYHLISTPEVEHSYCDVIVASGTNGDLPGNDLTFKISYQCVLHSKFIYSILSKCLWQLHVCWSCPLHCIYRTFK